MSNVLKLPGGAAREAPKALRSQMDTLLLTLDQVNRWELSPWQRELRETEKVHRCAEELKLNGGIISGIVTLGRLTGDPKYYNI